MPFTRNQKLVAGAAAGAVLLIVLGVIIYFVGIQLYESIFSIEYEVCDTLFEIRH